MKKIPCVFVVGPTASGKTALGARLCLALNGEVISADSMQIYQEMTVASAAPVLPEDTLSVPHHLVEVVPYGQSVTVAEYAKRARQAIREVAARGKLPVVVGGTGLYVQALSEHLIYLPQKSDPSVRRRWQTLAEQEGGQALWDRLAAVDPQAAAKLSPNDIRRLVRGLEVLELTGLTLTEQNRLSRQEESPYEPILIGITYRDRAELYRRIDRRVDRMLENGLVAEARRAYERRGQTTAGAVQAIGHKELFPYFDGDLSLEEAVASLKQATRRYAKRQLTWFRRDERIVWVYPDENEDCFEQALALVRERLTDIQERMAET